MLPRYFRWRVRQYAAVHIRPADKGGTGINKVAKDTVAALLERLERGEGILSALDENDGRKGGENPFRLLFTNDNDDE